MVASVILPAGSITQAVRVLVVDHRRVAVLHQPADDIAAHPPQADHAELHLKYP